jgi:hypothetical protein
MYDGFDEEFLIRKLLGLRRSVALLKPGSDAAEIKERVRDALQKLDETLLSLKMTSLSLIFLEAEKAILKKYPRLHDVAIEFSGGGAQASPRLEPTLKELLIDLIDEFLGTRSERTGGALSLRAKQDRMTLNLGVNDSKAEWNAGSCDPDRLSHFGFLTRSLQGWVATMDPEGSGFECKVVASHSYRTFLLVEGGLHRFAVPLSSVVGVGPKDDPYVNNLLASGKVDSATVVALADLWPGGEENQSDNGENGTLLVLGLGWDRFGLLVSRIDATVDGIVRELETNLGHYKYIEGGLVDEEEKITLVLNPEELMPERESSRRAMVTEAPGHHVVQAAPLPEATVISRAVSIRSFVGSILKSHGWRVTQSDKLPLEATGVEVVFVGAEFLGELRRRPPESCDWKKTVVLGGSEADVESELRFSLGYLGTVPPPYSEDDVVRHMKAAIGTDGIVSVGGTDGTRSTTTQ